jgi:hypothetical protein
MAIHGRIGDISPNRLSCQVQLAAAYISSFRDGLAATPSDAAAGLFAATQSEEDAAVPLALGEWAEQSWRVACFLGCGAWRRRLATSLGRSLVRERGSDLGWAVGFGARNLAPLPNTVLWILRAACDSGRMVVDRHESTEQRAPPAISAVLFFKENRGVVNSLTPLSQQSCD